MNVGLQDRQQPWHYTHLTILLKQNEQKRWPHCACKGLRRIFRQELHKCLSSRLLAKIFFGKPGLFPSREDGGDGSCAAIIPLAQYRDARSLGCVQENRVGNTAKSGFSATNQKPTHCCWRKNKTAVKPTSTCKVKPTATAIVNIVHYGNLQNKSYTYSPCFS